jgi:hypothetical protein
LRLSVAPDNTHDTEIRLHPNSAVYRISVTPAVNDEIAVIVEMAFIHLELVNERFLKTVSDKRYIE